MKGRGTMRNLGPVKRTTATMGSKPSDMFTPGWDATPGVMQHRDRIDQRLAMGQKETPRGRGTLFKGK